MAPTSLQPGVARPSARCLRQNAQKALAFPRCMKLGPCWSLAVAGSATAVAGPPPPDAGTYVTSANIQGLMYNDWKTTRTQRHSTGNTCARCAPAAALHLRAAGGSVSLSGCTTSSMHCRQQAARVRMHQPRALPAASSSCQFVVVGASREASRRSCCTLSSISPSGPKYSELSTKSWTCHQTPASDPDRQLPPVLWPQPLP